MEVAMYFKDCLVALRNAGWQGVLSPEIFALTEWQLGAVADANAYAGW
jgi:hypothetical protein